MAKTGTIDHRRRAPMAHPWLALIARIFVLTGALVIALTQLVSEARAQGLAYDPVDSGQVGLAGMLAGLLIFALAALYNHQRRSRDFTSRIARLEVLLESRDDRIWSLEERLARVTELIDAQGDLVVREDENGRVTHASAAVCALLGKKLDQIVGHAVSLDVRNEGARTTSPDGSLTFDQEIATPEGARWIAWKQAAVRDDEGQIVETQRVGRDVTARVAAERALADAREKAEAASRAKSRFLAVVSHEVRTPLNGILGMADLLLDTSLSPEQQTYGRAVKTSGEALLALIEEILDFSKIEAGRLDLDSVPFDPAGLVTEVVELIAPRAQAKGIEIAVDIDDCVPQRVVGDAARLRQVLLNLAGNAVKFTDQGGVSVVVERMTDGSIRFEVNDTGPGIGPEARARIFREFEQGDGTPARRHGGTGLGLAIAARIVERMGGEIALDSAKELDSTKNMGSRFSFTIELPEVPEPSPAATVPDLAGADVLVVSPSPVVGPLIERRLTAWGARVALAPSAEVAETLLPERAWAHVLVDRALGIESSIKLAQLSARFAHYRHILLAPAERNDLSDLRAAGFESYLVKPVRSASLAARFVAPDVAPPLVPDLDVVADRDQAPGRRALAILVVEDNDINALLIQAMLGKIGHIPNVVANGISAVTSVATAHAVGAPYDLVLMDLHLPGMDGFEATRRIRALGAEGGRVPIVALTANAYAEDREACREAGMDAFVVKPVDRARLEEAMATARAARAASQYGYAA
jgi:signal transduction histidine kinase/CheY-like chemotaxis protein